jgi:hypothetical protein
MSSAEDLQSVLDAINAKQIDSQQFNKRVVEIIREASRQRKAGEIAAGEFEEIRHKFGEAIEVMNSPGRVAAFAAMHGADWLDQESYAIGVRLTIEYSFAHNDAHVSEEEKRTFNAALKEISKMLEKLPSGVRVKAFSGMSAEVKKRVIAALPPALHLRLKRELIEGSR